MLLKQFPFSKDAIDSFTHWQIYERPPGAMVYVSSPPAKKPLQQPVMRSKNIEMDYLKYSTLPHVQKRHLAPSEHHISRTNDRIRTSSLPRDAGSSSARSLTAMELREKAALAAKKAAAASNQGDVLKDSNVSDGYLEDVSFEQTSKNRVPNPCSIQDPELLKLELQEAYNIMSVSRKKLLQYLQVLRRHTQPGNPTGRVQQTLEGIEEICSLLKPRYDTVFRAPAPIDTATEANEDHSQLNRLATAPLTAQRVQTPPTSLNLQRSYNYDLDCRRNSAASVSQYEIPEDRYSGIATKKLANRKEVEMHVFQQDFTDRTRRIDDKEFPSANPLRTGRRSSE